MPNERTPPSDRPERPSTSPSDPGARRSMVDAISALQNYDQYKQLHWEGSFEEYMRIVRERPQVTRNAFQRMYDMIISFGQEEYIDNKKRLVRYHFFKDEFDGGKDAI